MLFLTPLILSFYVGTAMSWQPVQGPAALSLKAAGLQQPCDPIGEKW